MSSEQAQPEEPLAENHWSDDPLGWMAVWADAQVPAPQMLRALGEEYGGRVAPALRSMADRVEAGEDLPTAFQATRSKFPRRLARQLAVVSNDEHLRTVLPALAIQRAETQSFSRQAIAVLAYPIVVLVASLAIIVLYALMVVPEFRSIFDDFGLDLPSVTVGFLAFSEAIPGVAMGLGVLVLLVIVLFSIPATARVGHYLLGAMPLFGRLWSGHGHHSLSRLMTAYTSAGMNGPESLRAAAEGLTDQSLAHAVRAAADRCESGASMAAAMASSKLFERPLTSLVNWGEMRGVLPAAFGEASRAYRIQTEHLLLLVRRVLPPVLMFCVGLFLLLMVCSLFLPLVSLIQCLS